MPVKKLKFFFIIQGEGRGHMMQALVLRNLLLKSGHSVCGMMVGVSPRRRIPDFFFEKIGQEVILFESPNFLLDRESKSLKVFRSILHNLGRSRKFFKSISQISHAVKEAQPDVIVNFYELLCGLYFLLYRPRIKHLALSHHFLLSHPDFPVPSGSLRDRLLMKLNNTLTSSCADKVLALSFRELSNGDSNTYFVVPPLLREEIKSASSTEGTFILSYILNTGYAGEIIRWHKENNEVEIHCFWDNNEFNIPYSPHKNLTFHPLNDEKFLACLESCKAYVSTAGFESVCEAIYLGKPVMLVPTEDHFEQLCNALDAVKSGAGIWATTFNYSLLLNYLPTHISIQEDFKKWADKSNDIFVSHLQEWR